MHIHPIWHSPLQKEKSFGGGDTVGFEHNATSSQCYNPLVFVNKMKNSNQWLLRWSKLCQQYNMEIRHLRGKDNIIADAL